MRTFLSYNKPKKFLAQKIKTWGNSVCLADLNLSCRHWWFWIWNKFENKNLQLCLRNRNPLKLAHKLYNNMNSRYPPTLNRCAPDKKKLIFLKRRNLFQKLWYIIFFCIISILFSVWCLEQTQWYRRHVWPILTNSFTDI